MTATAERFNNSSAVTFKNEDNNSKKRGITFGIQSAQSIPAQMITNNNGKDNNETRLPINFFHTPGEYNKMLIQLSHNERINNFDRQIGILKSLQFINEPIFEKAKQQRDERRKDYEMKKKEQKSVKSSSRISKCICCCCDDFCQDCAANTLCQRQESVTGIKIENQSKKMLIDIEGMKRGQYKKKKTFNQVQSDLQVQRCHAKKRHSKFRIEELISNTLIQAIQQKRDKQLIQFIKRQQKSAIKQFNQQVRAKNRCSSADKTKCKIQVKPTKSQIRQAYWESIKDIIAYELKKQHENGKAQKVVPKKQVCHRRSPQKYDSKKASKLQMQRGKSAEREILKGKLQKAEKIKNRMKMLLALDYKQKEIIKKCRTKKFKPNENMIETAFAHFV